MKTSVLRAMILMLAFFVLINCGYQVYVWMIPKYKVEAAYDYTLYQQFDAEGVIYKDETVISSDKQGVVQYLYKDGERVAYKSNVAMVYQDQQDVAKTQQIQQIDQQITKLNEAQGEGISKEADLSVLDQELKTDYYSLIQGIQHDQLSDLSDQKDTLATLFNKRQIVTGKVDNFNDSIQALTDQKNKLQQSITSVPQTVITPYSGYFVDATDGFEGQLTLKNATSVTAEKLQDTIDKIKQNDQKNEDTSVSGTIGKVITEPSLIYAALAPSSQVANLKEGTSCKLKFSKFSKEISATIQKINYNKDQEKSVLLFWTNEMTEELASVRYDTTQVILKSYTGLRVPKKAVRVNDKGESGVFVSNGQSMTFKKIDSVYEEQDYILSKIHSDSTAYLGLYDAVIVEGKDLYDNKPIR